MAISLSPETQELLKKIQSHLESAKELFDAINDADYLKIYQQHPEERNLKHCIKFGVAACDDLVE
jgi:NAD(P)H-hydrate repair Nnr-like enzyme with NAD(P)H-hydrate dehydratase domain